MGTPSPGAQPGAHRPGRAAPAGRPKLLQKLQSCKLGGSRGCSVMLAHNMSAPTGSAACAARPSTYVTKLARPIGAGAAAGEGGARGATPDPCDMCFFSF